MNHLTHRIASFFVVLLITSHTYSSDVHQSSGIVHQVITQGNSTRTYQESMLAMLQATHSQQLLDIAELIKTRQENNIIRILLKNSSIYATSFIAQALASQSGLPFVLVDCGLLALDGTTKNTDLATITNPYIDKDEPILLILRSIHSLPIESCIPLFEYYKNNRNIVIIATVTTSEIPQTLEAQFNTIIDTSSTSSEELKTITGERKIKKSSITPSQAAITGLSCTCIAGLIFHCVAMYKQSNALQNISYYTEKDYEARNKKYKREIILRQIAGCRSMRNTMSEERKNSYNVALQNEWAATVVGKAHSNYAIYKKSADISKYKAYILGEIESIQEQLRNKDLDASTKKNLTDTLTYVL